MLTFRDTLRLHKLLNKTILILAFKPICDNLDRKQTKLPLITTIGYNDRVKCASIFH